MRKALLLLILLVGTQLAAANQAGAMNRPPTAFLWLNDYNEALLRSKETGKPVFIDCFAEWCMWCHKMEDEVYSDPKFVHFMQKYILLRIDIEDGAEGTRLAEQLRVETLPTLLVINSAGLVINRIGGYLKTDELISDLTTMQNLIDRERANPNDWVAVKTLAEEYLFRDMNADAETRFSRILQAPVSNYEKESAHFSLALAQYYQQKNDEALHTLNLYLQTYVDGRSVEEVFLLLSQIYLEMNALDKARQILQQFLQTFPNSESAGRAREVLEKL